MGLPAFFIASGTERGVRCGVERRDEQRGPFSKPERFVWPPALREWRRDEAADVRAHEAAGEDAVEGLAREVGWWERVERTYLGVTSMPWRRRLEVARFAADSPEAWCFRCGRTVGAYEVVASGEDAGCTACRGTRVPWQRVVRLGTYRGVIRGTVLEIKNSAFSRLASDAGGDLGRQIVRCLELEALQAADAIVVPVPTSMWRRLARGIDHPLAIARGVRDGAGVRLAEMLTRQHRPMQTGSTLETRRRNVAGSMRVRLAWQATRPAARVVVLLDDVMTTGATMREAARALREAWRGKDQPEIWVAVLGVTPEKEDGSSDGGI